MQNDDHTNANPWADFEPISNPMHPNREDSDRRIISKPVAVPQQNIDLRAESAITRPDTLSVGSARINSQAPSGGTGFESPSNNMSPRPINYQNAGQNPAYPNKTSLGQEPPQFNTVLNNDGLTNPSEPSLNSIPPTTPINEFSGHREDFSSIAWPGESSGVETSSASLESTNSTPPNHNQPNLSHNQDNPIEQHGFTGTNLSHPRPDSIIENVKPKKSRFKLKIIVIIVLSMALIAAGVLFAQYRFRGGGVEIIDQNQSIQQKTAQEIIKLAQENKSQEIINKYIRQSNKEKFPTDQFKFNVQTFSEAADGDPTYNSENTGKVIVDPDTASSDMQVYVYTTNYKGYRGKIYIRIDLFKDAADGVWYLYAFSYNSNELKPDIVSN
jgi:hypothetical protein